MLKKSLLTLLSLGLVLSTFSLSIAATDQATSTSDVAKAETKSSKLPLSMEFHSITDYEYARNQKAANVYNVYKLSLGLQASERETFYLTPIVIHNLNEKYINQTNSGKVANKQVEARYVRSKWLEQDKVGFDLGTDLRHTANLPHKSREEVRADQSQARITAFRHFNELVDAQVQYRYYTTYGSPEFNDIHRIGLSSFVHPVESITLGLTAYEQRMSKTNTAGNSEYTNTLNVNPEIEYNNGVIAVNANLLLPDITKKSFGSEVVYELDLAYFAF